LTQARVNPSHHITEPDPSCASGTTLFQGIQREPDPKGDRVNVVLSGKFLLYKTY
jgi:hypothetical protein